MFSWERHKLTAKRVHHRRQITMLIGRDWLPKITLWKQHFPWAFCTSPSPAETGKRGAESETGPITDNFNLDGKTSIVLTKSMSWPRLHRPSLHLWAVIRNAILQTRKWVAQALLGPWSFPLNSGTGHSDVGPVFWFGFCCKTQQGQLLIFSVSWFLKNHIYALFVAFNTKRLLYL